MKPITFQDTLQASTVAQAILGAKASTPDGSCWTYVKASEAILKGHVVSPVAPTGVDTVSSSASPDGSIIYITEASAGWTVGEWANAWGCVDDGTGEGQVFKVKSNTADTLTLYQDWALGTALAVASSDITLSKVLTSCEKIPVTVEETLCIGVAQVAIASASYAWVLSKGPGTVIAGAAITAEKSFTPGDDTEGQVILGVTAEGTFDAFTIGYSIVANSTVDLGFLAMVGIPTA